MDISGLSIMVVLYFLPFLKRFYFYALIKFTNLKLKFLYDHVRIFYYTEFADTFIP